MDFGIEDDGRITLNDLMYEGFKNVLAKPLDKGYNFFLESFGKENIMNNGFPPRTRHELNSGLKCVQRRNISIDVEIVNLPFTVINARKLPAKTAFTTRAIDKRKIYLVPDHTETRIMDDRYFHTEGFNLALQEKEISQATYDLFLQKMDKLDVGERVAASIIHEFGHILTYSAFDQLGIDTPKDVYLWLDDTGYLENCSKRTFGFSTMDATLKINVALEQLAEDYRVSHDIFNGFGLSPLPHCLTFVQDAKNKEIFQEGVVIMEKVLLLDKKIGKAKKIGSNSALDYIVPFGEADRKSLSTFTQGHLTPLTDEIKQKDLEYLERFETSFDSFK